MNQFEIVETESEVDDNISISELKRRFEEQSIIALNEVIKIK